MTVILLLVGAAVLAAVGAALWRLLRGRKPAATDDLPPDRVVGEGDNRRVYRAFRIPATATVEAFTDALDLTLEEAASWDPKTEMPPPAVRARQQERYRNWLRAREGTPSRVRAPDDTPKLTARIRPVSSITTATRRTTLPGTQPHCSSRPPLKTVGHYPLGGARELPNLIIGSAPGVERRCSCGAHFQGSLDDVTERWEAHLHADERTFGSKAADRVFAWLEKRQKRVEGRAASANKARSLLKATSLLSVLFFLALSIDAGRSGRWNHDFKDPLIRSIAEAARSVGATGSTISATGTANWNTNGAWVGGVQPTAADDVVVPNTAITTIPSAVTALCRSINVQAGGTIAFAATTSNLNIGDASGGAATFSNTSTMTLTAIGTINFLATGGGTYSLTTGGKVMPNLTVNTSAATTIQFADAVTATGATITLTKGKLDTQSFAITCSIFSSSNSNTRTLTLGTSSISLTSSATPLDLSTPTNLVMTANSATFTMSGSSVLWGVGNINYNGTSVVANGPGTITIASVGASSTVANFTRTGSATTGAGFALNSSNALIVTGTLTLGGNTTQGVNRLLGSSVAVGTQRGFNVAGGAVVITGDVDFQDVFINGSPSWTNAGSAYIGDAGGNNSTITTNRTAPANQTATGTASFTWSTHGWTSRVPLPQDNVFIPNAFVAGRTITADMPRLGASIDFTGGSGSPSLANTVANASYGSLTLAGATLSGTSIWTLAGRGAFTISSAGATFPQQIIINAPGGSYTLLDALTDNRSTSGAGSVLSILNGTFVDAGFSVTLSGSQSGGTFIAFNVSGANSTLTKTGAWTIGQSSAATAWNAGTISTVTDSGSITFSSATANERAFAGGGKTYGTLTSSGTLTITGANTFAAINFANASNARTLTLPASTVTTVTGSAGFNVQGLVGSRMTVQSSASGTAATLALSATGDTAFCDFQDITATTSALLARRGRNVSGNTGITFPTIPVFDAAAAGTFSVSTASLTFSATINAGTNRMLRVGVSLLNAASQTVTGITYGGVAMTVAGTVVNGTGARGEMWYLVNPAVGTANVVVTLSAAAAVSAGGDSWSNVDRGAPIGLWTTATGTSTGPTVTVVSSTLEQVVDVATTAAVDLTVGPGQTADWDNGVAGVTGAGSREAGATSTTMSWTSTLSGLWAMGAAPIFGALAVSATMSGASSPIGTVVDTVKKFLSGSETPAGAVADTASKPLAGSTTPSGALRDTAVKVASGSTTPSGALIDTARKFLTGAETPAGLLTDTVSRSFSGSETPSGAVAKTPSTHMAGSETPSGALSDTPIKAAGGSLTPSGGTVQTADKGLSGSVTPSGQVQDTVSQHLAGSETPAGTVAKTASTHMAGSETPTGAVVDTPVKVLGGSESPTGAVVQTVDKALGGTETPSGSVTKNASIHLSGSETPTGTVARTLVRSFFGSLTPSGLLHTTPAKALGGILAPIGHLLLEAVHYIRDRRSCEVPTPTTRRNQTVIQASDRHNQP